MPTLTPVVPSSMARPKRIAKQLQSVYQQHSLSTCQSVTARLFGHNNWHALEQSVQHKLPTALFDEDLSSEQFKARISEQYLIICRDLGEIDPLSTYMRPERQTEEPVITSLRLAMANGRLQKNLATEVLINICPTRKSILAKISVNEGEAEFHVCDERNFCALPSTLAQWWSVNIPSQAEIGLTIKNTSLDPNSTISLLKFGAYWGALCTYHANIINWTMAMGTAYFLAERYASIKLRNSPQFHEIVNSDDSSAAGIRKFSAILNNLIHEFTLEFFDCYPRDDFFKVYSKQPMAFIENARLCVTILKDPLSKRGTWAHDNF